MKVDFAEWVKNRLNIVGQIWICGESHFLLNADANKKMRIKKKTTNLYQENPLHDNK